MRRFPVLVLRHRRSTEIVGGCMLGTLALRKTALRLLTRSRSTLATARERVGVDDFGWTVPGVTGSAPAFACVTTPCRVGIHSGDNRWSAEAANQRRGKVVYERGRIGSD